ncbi:uncharacterized protein LOC123524758 [Mercenaria mercenaria]|uniref:uncharacterized protein LOC123524758 n=1 Tax=Mercenaria mercenaria TaxID=6596 RepID=UPI00234F9D63|nr:uncharacterized protein LOC123524758 [Mercenaria mercenaria]
MKDYTNNLSFDSDAPVHSTDQSVHRLLDYINTIKDCRIVDVLNTEDCVNIKIHCFTCKAVEDFLKSVIGNEFQRETIVLRKCLAMQEHIKVHDVVASCSSESIENTRKRLDKRASTTDFTCRKHRSTQCTWYCSDDDKFFCSTCKDSNHRSCIGIKQVVSERSYEKQNQSLVVKRKIGKYNIRIKNLFMNRDDNDKDDCRISRIRILPDGNILLLDNGSSRLKKLDSSYNVVSHCDIPYVFYSRPDMCYIGDDRAVVCSSTDRIIQYVNVSGKLKLEHTVKLDHKCYGLACHGDTLYVGGFGTIYTYNRDCQEKHVLYNTNNAYFFHIAVSDDGERIYIPTGIGGLVTIDNKGNHLFTLKHGQWYETSDLCIVGDGTVLVLDTEGHVHQVDYNGKQVLGTVVDKSMSLRTTSMCFDRQRCRLFAAEYVENYIPVFQLQHHNNDTNIN